MRRRAAMGNEGAHFVNPRANTAVHSTQVA